MDIFVLKSVLIVSLSVFRLSAPEHVCEAAQCDAQLNISLCGRALRSVSHGQSKRSANVPLTLTGKPNPEEH